MKYWYSNKLSHHGIKGQKWGVRNGPPYPIEDKTLHKGQKLESVDYAYGMVYKDLNPKERKKRWKYTYNPDDKWDSAVYKGAFALFKSKWGQYAMKTTMYEVNKDLRMPTKKERVDAFTELYDSNPKKYSKDLKRTQNALKAPGVYDRLDPVKKKSADLDIDKFSSKSSKEDIDAAYNLFGSSMESVQAFDITRDYAKKMSKKYDAMVDDNNQGVYNEAHDPIIIFDQNNLTPGKEKLLKANEIIKNYQDVEVKLNSEGKRIAL